MRKNFWLICCLFPLLYWGCLNADPITPFPPVNIPQLLGWVPLPSCESICCGYYQDPLLSFATSPLPAISTTEVHLSADQSQFEQMGSSILIGNVTATQPGRLVSGDQAYLNRDPKSGKICSLDVHNNVVLREPGRLVIAEKGHIDLQSKAGNLFHAIYHFVLGGGCEPYNAGELTHPSVPLMADPNPLIKPLDAWGIASTVDRYPSGVIDLRNATYTTCAPTSHTWKLSASKIHLDPNSGRGTVYNSWLTFYRIPIFYTPYWNFPIDHRRKTGLLFPTYGHSSRSGYNLATPFYWNIAPNYDATFTPNLYTKRGVLGDAQFRYLTNHSSGIFNGGYIHHDSAFSDFKTDALTDFKGNAALGRLENSSLNRYYISWQNATNFNANWSTDINYNYVSDDYVLQDFNPPINTLVPNQLPQEFALNYHDTIWTATGKLLSYETLHPVNTATITNPYQSLPQLNLAGDWPDQCLGLHYHLGSQFVYFDRSRNPREVTNILNAQRYNLQPSISLPLMNLAGYFTPTFLVTGTAYQIGNQVPNYPSEEHRILPTFDIDSGLYFDRDTHFCGTNYQQTLEPRVFYLWTPYRNQNNLPLFDTALVPFSYDSLFLTNRFSGWDRIGDANQISASLTTRFLETETGAERFRASLGQIYYFRNRVVSTAALPGTPAAASSGGVVFEQTNLIGATSPTKRLSPLAGQLDYHFTPHWNAVANGVWDPFTRQAISASVNVQYNPQPNHILNLGYNYIRLGDPQPGRPALSYHNDLSLASASLAWPVLERWQVVGGLNYDTIRRFPQSYIYGLEYDSCCWAARFVAGRRFVGLNQRHNPIFDNAFYFQWQFKGLGNIGTGNPANFLIGNIPGYQDVFSNFSIL